MPSPLSQSLNKGPQDTTSPKSLCSSLLVPGIAPRSVACNVLRHAACNTNDHQGYLGQILHQHSLTQDKGSLAKMDSLSRPMGQHTDEYGSSLQTTKRTFSEASLLWSLLPVPVLLESHRQRKLEDEGVEHVAGVLTVLLKEIFNHCPPAFREENITQVIQISSVLITEQTLSQQSVSTGFPNNSMGP